MTTTYTFDNRSRRSRTGQSSTRRTQSLSPSALGDDGHDDGYYDDAEFDHELDAADAALNMRERMIDNARIRQHGLYRRRRRQNLPQGRAPRDFIAGNLDRYKNFSW